MRKDILTDKKLLSQMTFIVIAVMSLCYSIWIRKFAKVHIDIPFVKIPLFVGEMLFAVCALLWVCQRRLMKLPWRNWEKVVGVYLAWLLFKVVVGLKGGPLALRHAALFYYPLFALFTFTAFQREILQVLSDRVLAGVFFIMVLVRLGTGFSGEYFFPYMICFAIVILSLLRGWWKALGLIFLLTCYPLPDLLMESKSYVLGHVIAVMFILSYFCLLLPGRLRTKMLVLVCCLAVLAVGFARYGNKIQMKAFSSWSQLCTTFNEKDEYIQEKKKGGYVPQKTKVRLFNATGMRQFSFDNMDLSDIPDNLDKMDKDARASEVHHEMELDSLENKLQEDRAHIVEIQSEDHAPAPAIQPSVAAKNSVRNPEPKVKKDIVPAVPAIQPDVVAGNVENKPEPEPKEGHAPVAETQPNMADRLEREQLKSQLEQSIRRSLDIIKKWQDKYGALEAQSDTPDKWQSVQNINRLKALVAESQLILDRLNAGIHSSSAADAKQMVYLSSSLNALSWYIKEVIFSTLRTVEDDQSNMLFRVFIWRDMVQEFLLTKPLMGLSLSHPQRSPSIEVLGIAQGEWKRDGWIAPHNSYLHLIYRGGLVGVLIIIFILCSIVTLGIGFIKKKSWKGALLLSILIYWASVANFLVFLEVPYHAIPFWSLLGFLWAYKNHLERNICDDVI